MRPAAGSFIRRLVFGAAAAAVLLWQIAAHAGDPPGLVEKVESQYNLILVLKNEPHYLMTFGYNRALYTETVFDERDELALPVDYTRNMTVGAAYLPHPVEKVVEIGTGGGRTAWYLHKTHPKAMVATIELDPEVIRLAKTYFKVKDEPGFQIINSDGRLGLSRLARGIDLILVDAYRGPFVPFHLLTKEFFQMAKEKLRPGGVMVQNIEPTTMVFDAAVATIKSVFDNVDFYPSGGNAVIVAYDGPKLTPEELQKRAGERQAECQCRYALPELVKERRDPDGGIKGQVLTDDFAPVETLKAVERHNQRWVDPAASQ